MNNDELLQLLLIKTQYGIIGTKSPHSLHIQVHAEKQKIVQIHEQLETHYRTHSKKYKFSIRRTNLLPDANKSSKEESTEVQINSRLISVHDEKDTSVVHSIGMVRIDGIYLNKQDCKSANIVWSLCVHKNYRQNNVSKILINKVISNCLFERVPCYFFFDTKLNSSAYHMNSTKKSQLNLLQLFRHVKTVKYFICNKMFFPEDIVEIYKNVTGNKLIFHELPFTYRCRIGSTSTMKVKQNKESGNSYLPHCNLFLISASKKSNLIEFTKISEKDDLFCRNDYCSNIVVEENILQLVATILKLSRILNFSVFSKEHLYVCDLNTWKTTKEEENILDDFFINEWFSL